MLQKVESLSFEEKLEWGEEGEKTIASRLIKKGVAVAPLYQFKNHDNTPIMLTDKEQLILPDLTCWKDGKNFFVECKRKNQWVSYGGVVETGLDQRHFKEYCNLKAITGQKVYLFFIHENKDPGVFFHELRYLLPHMRLWNGRKPNGDYIMKPMALFPKKILRELL